MQFSKDAIVVAIMQALPYSEHVNALDSSEDNAVRFTWRHDRWRVSTSGLVEQVDGHFLVGNNAAILMEALLKRQLISNLVGEAQP